MVELTEPSRLLCVDDQVPNLALLTRIFSDATVVTARSGRDALHLLDSALPPDLILLDVVMPGEDGFSVCRQLKAEVRTRAIPVVFLTGEADPTFETKAFGLGAADYITKPFNPAVVRVRVQTQLALKRAREQAARQSQLLEEQVGLRTAQLETSFRQLTRASLEIVVRLARAAEYRDELTGEHVLRVSYYADTIGRHLNLAESVVGLLLRATPMHDIGKIGVPDQILLKPGPLTADEWALMKEHPDIGGRILAGSEFDVIRVGEVIARTHHEQWNGGGYPRGLRGEDIPIAGRVVALADVFDGLTSRRPYKDALSIERSFDLIRSGRGAQFDPSVVDGFFAAESDILQIKATYEDRNPSPLVRLATACQTAHST
jgi:putative two-component system response regulator